jgi:hypothetical protein
MSITQQMTVEERNAWFENLPRQEKRIQLAKDLLEQLAAEQLSVNGGSYLNVTMTDELIEDLPNLSTQQLFQKAACAVCAKGALLFARVTNYNNYQHILDSDDQYQLATYKRLSLDNQDVQTALDGIFTPFELDLIEAAFEGSSGLSLNAKTDDEVLLLELAANMFREVSYRNSLVQIAKNIIDNGGNFVVPGFHRP